MTYFRATFSELIIPFFVTSGVISIMLIMQRLYTLFALMVERLFGVQDVGLLLLYLLPEIFSISIPLGVVGAVFITVIRQSVDAEIICMRAAGTSLWKYSIPLLLFGLIATFAAASLTLWLQPIGYERYAESEARIVKANADENLLPGRFHYQFGNKAIQIGARASDDELSDIFIADRVMSSNSSVIMADKGRIDVDEQTKLVYFRLRNGAVYLPTPDPEVLRTVNFERLNYRLEFKPTESIKTRRLKWTTTLELIRQARSNAPVTRFTPKWLLELFSRLTLPLACLVFVFAAIPMAIVDPRSGKSGSFLRAIFLVVTYYIIWIGFKDLVKGGNAPAGVMWLPLLLVGSYGLFRLWQTNGDMRILPFNIGRRRKKS
ncbi:MAG: LptF/LptG family permease [SAR324 cluster bacterium]|nr:LptF/LptG family permease [SAR324 cluster bacterium]